MKLPRSLSAVMESFYCFLLSIAHVASSVMLTVNTRRLIELNKYCLLLPKKRRKTPSNHCNGASVCSTFVRRFHIISMIVN